MRNLIVSALVLLPLIASAETVAVKYHGAVSLDAFACSDVRDDTNVSRICYDRAERYMVIRLKSTYYHYCQIDAATVQGLRIYP